MLAINESQFADLYRPNLDSSFQCCFVQAKYYSFDKDPQSMLVGYVKKLNIF